MISSPRTPDELLHLAYTQERARFKQAFYNWKAGLIPYDTVAAHLETVKQLWRELFTHKETT